MYYYISIRMNRKAVAVASVFALGEDDTWEIPRNWWQWRRSLFLHYKRQNYYAMLIVITNHFHSEDDY